MMALDLSAKRVAIYDDNRGQMRLFFRPETLNVINISFLA